MKSSLVAGLLPLLAQLTAAADLPSQMMLRRMPLSLKLKEMSEYHKKLQDDDSVVTMGHATFDQLIDHKNPSKGTFKQRYWWNAEFYKKGGPIFLFCPGESDASGFGGYLENSTLPGEYAQQFNGAAIILEHRYFGDSLPFNTFTTETLQYLNLPNSISDLTNFANSVNFLFCNHSTCNSKENPWVLMGGSYSGALAAWTSQIAPGVFHAYHASSAVVQAIYDFWEYFTPIADALPESCRTDLQSIISHIDQVLQSEVDEDILALKSRFGLSALGDADFTEILTVPLTQWQSSQSAVLDFCDYLQNPADNSSHLDAYGSYINATSTCGEDGANCNTYNPNILWNRPDRITDDYSRAWTWMLCNEPFGWWQVGPPTSDGTAIVSSALRPDYNQRKCPLIFPETNGFTVGSVAGFTVDHLNGWTGGWDAPFERVLFVNGQYDPWRQASIASDSRPGGPVPNSDTIPSLIVKQGNHVPEFLIDQANPNITSVVQEAVGIMGGWLKEWKKPKNLVSIGRR